MPSYLKNHKDVLKQNERVNLLGEWCHGFFSMSFVGALNVGSIVLHFDEALKSNIKAPKHPYLQDKNYALLMNQEDSLSVHGNQYMRIPQLKTQRDDNQLENLGPTFSADDLTQYLNEFDIKDIPQDWTYSVTQEQKLAYSMLNGFKLKNEKAQDEGNQDAELVSKLETPSTGSGRGKNYRLSSYTITPNGIQLHKGEELGMFQMGSTIALIFECPEDYTVVKKEGEQIQLGQSLVSSANS